MYNLLRFGIFLFIAATLGLCRMLPFPRYTDYLDEDDGTSSKNIVTLQDPDTNSNRPNHNTNSPPQTPDLTIQVSFNPHPIPNQDNHNHNPNHNPNQPPLPSESLELLHARRALKKIKELLGPEKLRSLLHDDIESGNEQWHFILAAAAAASNTHSHKLAEVHLLATQRCTLSPQINFTAPNFLAWFMNSAFNTPQNLWAGHPEHYGIHLTPNPDGTLRGEILEPWGPLMTDSFVPRFTPVGAPGVAKKPWMRDLSGYPMQMIGEETLMDGSGAVIANLHYSYRDVEAGEGCSDGGRGGGVEGIFAMWMPSETPDDVVLGLREHLEVEYINWLKWAFEDIQSGVFKPQ